MFRRKITEIQRQLLVQYMNDIDFENFEEYIHFILFKCYYQKTIHCVKLNKFSNTNDHIQFYLFLSEIRDHYKYMMNNLQNNKIFLMNNY
jgi:tagatose-1,6-bisphosphate aldolase non-catalytic subunit AgaZ/GatZ